MKKVKEYIKNVVRDVWFWLLAVLPVGGIIAHATITNQSPGVMTIVSFAIIVAVVVLFPAFDKVITEKKNNETLTQ